MANETVARDESKTLPDGVSVVLIDSGKTFSGWEDLTITKNLDALASTFSFTYDNKFGDGTEVWPIRPGLKVRILIGDEVVITGRIETMLIGFSAGRRMLKVTGRSLVGDIIDSSVPIDVIEFSGTLKAFAETLVKPFGLKVFLSVVPKDLDRFSTKQGETIFTALDRAARAQGFFWISTREGNLRLTEAGVANSDTALDQNINIKQAAANLDESQRFSTYTVLSQRSSTDNFKGLNITAPFGFAEDRGVERFRPFVKIAESSLDSAGCQDSAGWEASVRAAKSLNLTVTVQGWRQATGALWGINQLIRFRSDILGLDDTFLSKNITHSKSNEQGTISNITLVRKDSFKKQAIIEKKNDPFQDLGKLAK